MLAPLINPLIVFTAALLAAAATLFALYTGWKRLQLGADRRHWARLAFMAAIRLVGIFLIGVILLNPIAGGRSMKAPAGRSLILVLDASKSMQQRDVAGQTRFNTEQNIVRKIQALAGRNAQPVHLIEFGGTGKPTTTRQFLKNRAPHHDRTDLAGALVGAETLTPLGPNNDFVLISDGHDTEKGFPVDVARAIRTGYGRVDTVCLGRPGTGRSIRISVERNELFALPNQTFIINAVLDAENVRRAHCDIRLQRGGKTVHERMIRVISGRQSVQFSASIAHPGMYHYEVALSSAADPVDRDSHYADITVTVQRRPIRILVLEGSPGWDSKFLADTLRRTRSCRVDVIYKLTPTSFYAVLDGRSSETTIRIPQSVHALSHYDVLVIGKGIGQFYRDGQVSFIRRWVSERGGQLVLLRGRPAVGPDPFADLEPFQWGSQPVTDLKTRLTEEAATHPGFNWLHQNAERVIERMPALLSATQISGEKALTVTLVRAQNSTEEGSLRPMALIGYQRYGEGRVFSVVGEGLWRWAFLPESETAYSDVYFQFWSQIMGWLASGNLFRRGQTAALRPLQERYSKGDTVNLLGYWRDKSSAVLPAIRVTLPDGSSQLIPSQPGGAEGADFNAVFPAELPGNYRAMIMKNNNKQAGCWFHVTAISAEDRDRAARPRLMQEIAGAGGGNFFTPSKSDELYQHVSNLLGSLATARTRIAQSTMQSAWDRSWILALLLTFLLADWSLRYKLNQP